MKSKILKFAVLASAIAFINCGDETALAPYLNGGAQGTSSSSDAVESEISSSDVAQPGSSATAETGSETSSSSGAVQQGSNTDAPASSSDESCLASCLPDACGPGTNPLPTSSSDAAVASSADAQSATSSANVQEPASSSSEAAKPASSSSEKKVESSSSETKVESSSSAEAPKGIFLASGKEEEKDQMQVEYKTRTGWDGGGILSYPKQLSSTQKHGVVVWGPGGGTEPGAYEGMIRRLASHGFVVIALKESPGNASQAIKALDWLDKQNKDQNSPLYGKLDMNTVGCSGHSMGGLESEQAVIKDKRVLTAFLNNSGDWNGAGAKNVATDRTIAILFGEVGMEKDNAKNDYNNSGVKAPACLIEMTGGPRNSEGGYGHGSGSWDGMAATVAWMRWHLGGETERKADFVGTTGKYIDGSIIGKQGKWKTQCKNF
ncbi:esterase [Fibrobacter sp. UWB2]|uniref:alpha/beta hydrolase family protein n=1 Tax=Fibrobacter sp. UWB2 TaxID=1964358 RepID=UPI000B5274D4|nr:esterase [Fibrobacter sp. UWB2]OWV21839.1 esterase [Fibrobacter sp. UWB2]